MPILELPPAGSELAQGDVLGGVTLYASDVIKGAAVRIPERTHCLVISRDCVAIRDPLVVVAPVKRFVAEHKPDDEDDVREFYEGVRDGLIEPDLFYLGSFGPENDRFAARLDELCTIKLPPDEAARKAWIDEHRLARLTTDFVRALPVRLFMTFARVGYDDHHWYCTPDLEWFVKKARAGVAKKRVDVANAEAALAQTQATAPGDRKRAEVNARDIANAKAALEEAESRLAPFEVELRARLGARPEQAEGRPAPPEARTRAAEPEAAPPAGAKRGSE
jgi:hypothetical protein